MRKIWSFRREFIHPTIITNSSKEIVQSNISLIQKSLPLSEICCWQTDIGGME